MSGPLAQARLDARALAGQESVNGALGAGMFARVLEGVEGGEVARAGILERGDGELWEARLMCEGAAG